MYKMYQNSEELDYSDVFIVPQYSEITTRTEIDTSSNLGWFKVNIPVISANMDTITEWEMATAMHENGAIGALHRFNSIQSAVTHYNLAVQSTNDKDMGITIVSIGVNRDSKERAQALYEAGARHFVIDIAHGHSKSMKDMIGWMKSTFKDIYVIAGNVCTANATRDLAEWGADFVKVGIGPGSVCLTKDVTGVTFPQFSAVLGCSGHGVPIIADGGIKSIGDIAKALGAGADFVMLGGMLAGTDECPGEVIDNSKVYRGMASRDAMRRIRVQDQMPTPEGLVTTVPCKGPVGSIIQDIGGGLRSAFSYVNARNLKEFQDKAKFGIRRTVR